MGTHPIFESDFDCLTEWTYSAQFVFLRFSRHIFVELVKMSFAEVVYSARSKRQKSALYVEKKLIL